MRHFASARLAKVVLVGALLPALASAQGLSFHGAVFDGVGGVTGLTGPRGAAISPDGANLYVASEGANAVAVFARNQNTGDLSFVEAQVDGVGGVDGLMGAAGVVVSPDGKNVYSSSAFEAAVAVFSRNTSTGALTFVEAKFNGVGGITGLTAVVGITISPDGNNVYATGFSGDSVVVFTRNPATGALTYLESKTNGVGGVTGIDGPFGIDLSPDGAQVYVTGFISDAVAVFTRNPATGALTFLEAQVNNVGGVVGLNGARSIAISNDGANAYVSGNLNNAIVSFSRAGNGALTFINAIFDVGNADGTFNASVMVVDPDDTFVYSGAFGDDSVGMYQRNLATGELSLFSSAAQGVGGVDGMLGVLSIAQSPDGNFLYVPGFQGNSLAIFSSASSVVEVPTLSQWGLVGLGGLLALFGVIALSRRRGI